MCCKNLRQILLWKFCSCLTYHELMLVFCITDLQINFSEEKKIFSLKNQKKISFKWNFWNLPIQYKIIHTSQCHMKMRQNRHYANKVNISVVVAYLQESDSALAKLIWVISITNFEETCRYLKKKEIIFLFF